jgi:hypothetical protein
MSGKGCNLKYTKDEIMRLNVYNLRKIPDSEKYSVLRKFVLDERSINLSNVVKQPMIPTYLRNRYGDLTMGAHTITKGNFRDQPEPTRRKLYVHKNETVADQINEEIRDLLSKLSTGNKDKLLENFMKKNIPDECGQTLIDNIYLFAVDLTYLTHIYVELIFKLKEKNLKLYDQLMGKIVTLATDPMIIEDQTLKRMRTGNIILISEIYKKNSDIVNDQMIIKIIHFLLGTFTPQKPDSIQILCELLKKCVPILKIHESGNLEKIIQNMREIAFNHEYDKRYRFMIQDIIDIYNEEDD